jgi:hypothetical protein
LFNNITSRFTKGLLFNFNSSVQFKTSCLFFPPHGFLLRAEYGNKQVANIESEMTEDKRMLAGCASQPNRNNEAKRESGQLFILDNSSLHT